MKLMHFEPTVSIVSWAARAGAPLLLLLGLGACIEAPEMEIGSSEDPFLSINPVMDPSKPPCPPCYLFQINGTTWGGRVEIPSSLTQRPLDFEFYAVDATSSYSAFITLSGPESNGLQDFQVEIPTAYQGHEMWMVVTYTPPGAFFGSSEFVKIRSDNSAN